MDLYTKTKKTDVDYYLIGTDGEQTGPHTLGQIRSMLSSGSVTLDSLYWIKGMAEWRPLREIESSWETSGKSTNKPNSYVQHSQQSSLDSKRIMGRYDAVYLTASWIVFWGKVLIVIGLALGIIIVGFTCLALSYAKSDDSDAQMKIEMVLGGFFGAIGVASPFIISGFFSLVAGQILRAFVDTAVNTSPLMSPHQKAAVMGVN